MANIMVAGDLYETITGQLFEIGRQIRQPNGYPFDALRLKEHLQEAIEGRFGSRVEQTQSEPQESFPVLPAIDEWFDLEVNDDMDPMLVVSSAGFDLKGWEYLGPQFSGKKTYRVKLIELGSVKNLEDARQKARAKNPKYRLLEGQAREPFKAKYPRHNGRPIVFGGSVWQDPHRFRNVACLGGLRSGRWRSNFDWSGDDFVGRWLWPVVEQD